MATSREENTQLIDQFIAVTGAARNVAVSMLEACAGNLELAVGMHMDGHGAPGSSGLLPGETERLSSGPHDLEENGVRAPIPQKTEVLVEEDDSKYAHWRMRRPRRMVRSVFDGFRDFQSEANHYESSHASSSSASSSKKRNLEDLFRPPVDITHKGSFQTAKDLGSSTNRWLLVNVQNVQEFECQVLNRDVWSCPKAKKLVSARFIFWQVYNDSAEGKRFMQFYKVTQWPFVAILDPFTGENQVTWHKITDGKTFCDLANEFLQCRPAPNKCDENSPPCKRAKLDSIVDASEQDQMEAAILASLRDNEAKSKSPHYVIESDSDVIADSDDEEPYISDSDSTINSSPVKKSQTSTTSQSKCLSHPMSACSTSSSSSYQSSSKASTSVASDGTRRKPVLTKCMNTSTSTKPFCASDSLSVDVDDCETIETGSTSCVSIKNISTSKNLPRKGNKSSNDSSLSTSIDAPSDESPDWKQFWGDSTDPMSKIMIRFPDGKRDQVELPCSSCLKALKTYCAASGFTEDKYELVTNFPRRKLSEMDDTQTLKDIGLHPQDTVFLQDL